MAGQYAFRSVSLRTGRVLGDLPLLDVTAQQRIGGGKFDAKLKLPTAAPEGAQRDTDLARCRDLLNVTTPGVNTVLVLRNGKILGEWLLWSRDRSQRPVPIGGEDLTSWFRHAAIDGFADMLDADNIRVAKALIDNALAKPFPIGNCSVDTPALTGNVLSKASYRTGTEYVGVIVEGLGADLDGFDWWIDTEWDTAETLSTVKRTIRWSHPHRGRVLQGRLDLPARGTGQSGVSFGLLEDATKVATTVYMTGASADGKSMLVARGRNADLYGSYPDIDYIDSRSSYDSQKLLNAQAAAVAAASRTADLPSNVRVRADGDLPLGSYVPGDTVTAVVEPWEVFPDGLQATVRIVGFTVAPPADGATEMVDIEIESGDASVFDT